MDRAAIREEIDLREQRNAFWNDLFRQFPIVRGHREIAEGILEKRAAEIGPMAIDEAIVFLGNATVKEIERRRNRDEHNREALAYEGGPSSFVVDSDGVTSIPSDGSELDHDPREFSLGDVIRRRKEARRNGAAAFVRRPANREEARKRASTRGV